MSHRSNEYLFLLLFTLLFVVLSACSSTNTYSNSDGKRKAILDTATNMLGSPYKYGGKDINGFDCSGLTTYVYNKQGVLLKGSSSQQAKMGRRISRSKVRPGDLLFFEKSSRIFHLGIVTKLKRDELWIIHSTTSKGVILENIQNSSYWKNKLSEFRSVLN